ncbi:MAG: SWIB/MDM2 domain-containing protein [Bdellovibrionota bacterium]
MIVLLPVLKKTKINNPYSEDAMAKATKKKATKKATTTKKKTVKKASGAKRKPNAAFMKPLTPSAALAEVIGAKPIPRTQVVKKLWSYIHANKLQDTKNRRNINADAKLKPIFGKNTVSMFEMTKLVSKHLR